MAARPHGSGLLDVPVDGPYDREAAERAPAVVLHGAGSRPPLVFVRSWVGEVEHYRGLARHLGGDQPLYAIAPPQGETRDDYPTTVPEWAAFCLERFQRIPYDGPVVLGGWSFGGAIALELGERLVAQGRAVPRIVMFDTRLPKHHPKRTPSELQRALRHVDELLTLPRRKRVPFAAEKLRSLWQRRARPWATRLTQWVAETAPSGSPAAATERPPAPSPGAPRANPIQASTALLRRAVRIAYLKYEPRASSLHVSLYWCADTCHHVGNSSLGWCPYLRGEFESVCTPGDHLTMFDEPYTAALAAYLSRTLAYTAALEPPYKPDGADLGPGAVLDDEDAL